MYKSIWFKIHCFLGVFFGLTLFILGSTGAILSYEKEILRYLNKDIYFVEIPKNKEILSLKEILEKYQSENLDDKINGISLSNNNSSSVVLNILKKDSSDKRVKSVYVNPYTGTVLPDLIGKDFFTFVLKLHRWLAFEGDLKDIGKNIVAITTIFSIVLVISGLIIYFPRIKNSFLNSFIFSFKYKKRAFISSFHSVIGIWVAPFLLLLCLTGLYWSYDWYRNGLFYVFNTEQPKKEQSIKKDEKIENLSFENVQKIIDIFVQNVSKDYQNIYFRFVPNFEGNYVINYTFKDAINYGELNSMYINLDKNIVVKDLKFENKKLNEKIMSSILALHTGEYFGWIGQFFMFISSAFMIVFVITGYMLYYDRYKKRREKSLKIVN